MTTTRIEFDPRQWGVYLIPLPYESSGLCGNEWAAWGTQVISFIDAMISDQAPRNETYYGSCRYIEPASNAGIVLMLPKRFSGLVDHLRLALILQGLQLATLASPQDEPVISSSAPFLRGDGTSVRINRSGTSWYMDEVARPTGQQKNITRTT
jgi:hypothetical protein